MKFVLKSIEIIIALATFASVVAFISERIFEIKNKGAKFLHKPHGIYERFIKRPLDCFLSTGALIVLSPVMIILTIMGAIKMKGNPFFTQDRPGRIDSQTGKERIFKLIKYRSMTNEKDENGNLLPNEQRLSKYGKILRASSADELGELINIIKGDMAIIGPRPLLPEYIPFYTEQERHRHDVRPGLTGLAQVNGRNAISSWEERFNYDLQYVDSCSFKEDVKIVVKTILKVVKRSDILDGNNVVVGRLDEERNKRGTLHGEI